MQGAGGGGEGSGQDQARKEVVQEVVKWLKAQVTKPDSLASVPKLWPTGPYYQLWASLKDKLVVHSSVALQQVGSSQTRDQTQVSGIAGQILDHSTTREALSLIFFSLPRNN